MPQSLARNLIHLVFSTKNREPVLAEAVRLPLSAYASAVLRELDSHVIAINAWRDHVHILFTLSKNHSLAQVVMEVKREPPNGSRHKERNSQNFIGKADTERFPLANRVWRK
jgi:putative transposase